MTEDRGVVFNASGLLSKWGFGDGDAPDLVLDYCDELAVAYPSSETWHAVLTAVVRQLLAPLLDEHVELVEIDTIHNPIRAERVDGQVINHYATEEDLPALSHWSEVRVFVPVAELALACRHVALGRAVSWSGFRSSFPDVPVRWEARRQW